MAAVRVVVSVEADGDVNVRFDPRLIIDMDGFSYDVVFVVFIVVEDTHELPFHVISDCFVQNIGALLEID